MRQRYLGLLLAFSAITTFTSEVWGLPDAWVGTHYGVCYTSVSNAMADVYGPDYATDDNIAQKYLIYGAEEMIISVDHTSGTNEARTVFERRQNGNWCVALTSPPVSSLVPIVKNDGSTKPLRWVTLAQAAPGYPETKVIYILDEKKSIYFPKYCYHIYKKRAREFRCIDAYKQ
jgi:hypothetical protein